LLLFTLHSNISYIYAKGEFLCEQFLLYSMLDHPNPWFRMLLLPFSWYTCIKGIIYDIHVEALYLTTTGFGDFLGLNTLIFPSLHTVHKYFPSGLHAAQKTCKHQEHSLHILFTILYIHFQFDPLIKSTILRSFLLPNAYNNSWQ
jgi:hypothetical protein